MSGGLLVAGTTSDAGKSVVTAGICRWLYRRGVKVAPFKAQNMSNNSAVAISAVGRGGEIGRAQALQAAACGLAPDVRFNPVLLKPGSDLSSQVVLLGEAVDTVRAGNYRALKPRLAGTVFDTFAALRDDYEVVICEGAGSPAEINLRDSDFVNMGLARHAGLPTVVVGDIDRGGVFASFFGTLALLSAEDQALVAGFVVNKFRGDVGLLQPGVDALRELTGRPTYGILPWQLDLWLDAEDSLAYGTVLGRPGPPRGADWLRVAVIRLPRVSNATDAEALASEPGVRVRLTIEPAEVADADLVVLPGSKSTVDDLAWLRETGLADAVTAHAAAGRPVLGICGGFQMLATRIHDQVESRRGTVDGLGLLPVEITFGAQKTVTRSVGTAYGGVPVHGYEIHHGYVSSAAEGVPEMLRYADGPPEGAALVNVFGTHWHGAFESDEFRRRFLTEAARLAGRGGFTVAADTSYAGARERTLDLLGDLIEENLDTDALWRLIEQGPPAGLPFIPPGAPPSLSRASLSRPGTADLSELVAEVLRRPAGLGGTRLVCVDGPSGAGKSVFAARLAAVFPHPVPVVHTDDLLAGWDDQLDFWPRLRERVLLPLRSGRPGHYQAYDWVAARFGGPEIEVPPAPVVIVEGVSAARAAVRDEATLTVFVTAPLELRLARSATRDGDALRPYLEVWRHREERHFAADATASHVDLVVETDASGRQRFLPLAPHRKGATGAVDGGAQRPVP